MISVDNFVHIPKTAGSSLRTVLTRQYGLRHIAHYEPGSNQPGASSLQDLRDGVASGRIRLITGHHPFGLHSELYSPVRYFTLLRDPISRASSDYFFAYSYKHHRLKSEILSGQLTPEAFLIHSDRAEAFDAQCRIVSGHDTPELESADRAFGNLQSNFVAFGIAERFEESLLYLAKRLGWAPPLHVKRNVTKLPYQLEIVRMKIEERMRSECFDKYAADIRLHERASAKLTQDIEAEGKSFRIAFEAFREIQDSVNKADEANKYRQYEFDVLERLPDFVRPFISSKPYRVLLDYLEIAT